MQAFLALGLAVLTLTLLFDDTGDRSFLADLFPGIFPMFVFLLATVKGMQPRAARFIYDFVGIYGAWLSTQTMIAAVKMANDQGQFFKGDLIVSVGGSNFVAAHLLTCFVFLAFTEPHRGRTIHVLVTVFVGISMLVTGSFGSLVALMVIVVISLIWRSRRDGTTSRRAISVLALGALTIGVVARPVAQNGEAAFGLARDLEGIYSRKLLYWQEGNYSRLLADRDEVFRVAVNEFIANPWLGSGRLPELNGVETRTHNWILDLLVTRGAVGTLIYIGAILCVLALVLLGAQRNRTLVAIGLALLAGCVHGFVEPNFLSRQFDFIWWVLAGVGVGMAYGKDCQHPRKFRAVSWQRL